VQGKSYDSQHSIGKSIWNRIELLVGKYRYREEGRIDKNEFVFAEPDSPLYGNTMTKYRIGQGAFRVMVTDGYSRRCSITGEKTLPVLEAAHIKPYAVTGPHLLSNGILLRSDLHKLFDTGYLTITKDRKVEISSRIKEEYQNGKEYYQYHGKDLLYLPVKEMDRPDERFIEWHNEKIYKG
jgi:putative restriction endonuclease